MQVFPSIFAALLQPLQTVPLKSIVALHDADAYDKSFESWPHLVAMIYAQLSGANSLRAVAAGFNAHAHLHRQLGAVAVHRSTLSDANSRRPVAVFADVLAALARGLGRKFRAQGQAIIRILDASPIPLGRLFACGAWNGRTKGLKLHLAFDPASGAPQVLAITKATVNDISPARQLPLEAGVCHVFDKAYCSFDWWTKIAQSGSFFVTRPKANMRWTSCASRPVRQPQGDGFSVLADQEIKLTGDKAPKVAIPLRIISVKPDKAKPISILTNDMRSSATRIAGLYKQRWQIELLFRWLKQHLKLKTFLGRSENAIKLQILAAMIAYVLIKLAAFKHRTTLQPIRFAELIALCLFEKRPFFTIARPKHKDRRKPCRKNPCQAKHNTNT